MVLECLSWGVDFLVGLYDNFSKKNLLIVVKISGNLWNYFLLVSFFSRTNSPFRPNIPSAKLWMFVVRMCSDHNQR